MIQQLVIDHAKFDDSDLGFNREVRESSETSSAKRTFSAMGSSLDEQEVGTFHFDEDQQIQSNNGSGGGSGVLKSKTAPRATSGMDERNTKY